MQQITELFGRKLESYSATCETHGDYHAVRVAGTDAQQCPVCMAHKLSHEEIEKAARKRIQTLFDACSIPDRFRSAGFKNYEQRIDAQKAAVAKCGDYVKTFKREWRPLQFYGYFGTGKTHLACAIGNNLISKDVSVKYTTMQTMLGDIKRAYSKDNGVTEQGQVEKYVNGFDMLILDEVDIMRSTDNDLSLVFAVINGRYNAMKPVITISNQPVAKLAEFIGARTVDRLNENATIVVCDWESNRSK